MNNAESITCVKEAILLMERIQMENNHLDDLLLKSSQQIKKHTEEIKTIQNKLNLLLNALNNPSINTSEATVNQPLKQTEPMTVKDAISHLRKSHIYLSDYGYHLSSSFETRYNSLKKAMSDYPLDSILQKLRALIIVWSQNAVDHIKSAETYVNNLRADFHTLQEESLTNKNKCS